MIKSYLPSNKYSTFMYGAYSPQTTSSSSSTRKPWEALPDYSDTSATISDSNFTTTSDGGGYGGAYSDYAVNELGRTADITGRTANPYSRDWALGGLRDLGVSTARNVGVPAAAFAAAGMPISQALGAGMQLGMNPISAIGGLSDLVAGSMGIPSSGVASGVGTVLGGLVAGPVGAILGRVAAPFAADVVGDIRGTRNYETMRDIAEDAAGSYGMGRTIGSAYAQGMDRLSNLPGAFNLGISTAPAAAAIDATTLGSLGFRNELADPLGTAQAMTRAQLGELGYSGWESNALMSNLQTQEDFNRAAITSQAIAQVTGTPFRSTSVQQAADAAGLGGLSDAAAVAVASMHVPLNDVQQTKEALSAMGFTDKVAREVATTAKDISTGKSSGSGVTESAVKSSNKNVAGSTGGFGSGGSSDRTSDSGKDVSSSSGGSKSSSKN